MGPLKSGDIGGAELGVSEHQHSAKGLDYLMSWNRA